MAISGAPVMVVKRGGSRSQWKILCFGLFISLTTAAMWAAQSSLHLDCFVSAPAFSTTWVYLTMSLHLIPMLIRGRKYQLEGEKPDFWFLRCIPLRTNPRVYIGISCTTVCSFYLSIRACKYTTLTSISLLDSLGIPAAMATSSMLMERRYKFLHVAGVLVCVFGVLSNAFGDYIGDDAGYELVYGDIARRQGALGEYQMEMEARQDPHGGISEYPYKLTGDIFALIGGILGGVTDVLTERTVRHNGGAQEYLAMVGLFSFLLSGVLALVSEREEVNAWFFQNAGTCPLRSSILMLFVFMSTLLIKFEASYYFLLISEAALLNLILLTSNLFSGIFEIFEQGIAPSPLFWVGLFMVLLGIFIYEQDTSPSDNDCDNTSTASSRVDIGTMNDYYRHRQSRAANVPFDIQFQNYT